MNAEQWSNLCEVAAVVLFVGFTLLMWRLVRARRWRLLAASAGIAVLLLLIAGTCGYRYGYYDALRGGLAQGTGDLDVALEWFERAYTKNPDAFMVAHDIACCYALKGDEEQCFTWLERAVKSRYGVFAREIAASDKDFDSVRGSIRFQELLRADTGK